MAKTTVQVLGLSDLGRRMERLKAKAARSVATGATGAAAGIIKKQTIRNIERNPSIETGSMRDAVIVKKIPKSQTNLTSEHIVTFRGKGKPYNKKGQKIARAPHARFPEFGTVNMPAEPSLRPAFDSHSGEALEAMVAKIEKRLLKEQV